MVRHTQHTWRRVVRLLLVVPVLLLATACATSSTAAGSGTPTATTPPLPTTTPTPLPTCSSAVPGAGAINLQSQGFIYPIVFPQGTVGTAPQKIASGTGLFTVYTFTACSPNTTTGGVQSFFSSSLGALQHGWITAQTFPADGGLMVSCGAACWWNPKGGPLYYLIFDQYADKGNGVITYQARWAVSPDFPTCGSNFTSGQGSAQLVYFLPGYTPPLPLPPISSTAPDDATSLRGYDVCSPGTAQSVSAFMTKELPVTGWTKIASNPACFYTSQCWKNGSAVISWQVQGNPLTWFIAWHPTAP